MRDKLIWPAVVITCTFIVATGIYLGLRDSRPQPPNDIIVYVTRTGECYHRGSCGYLKSKIPMKLSEARKRYRPCSKCRPPQTDLVQERFAPPDGSKHKVLKVVDGDTVTIETTEGSLTVRVIGIDTPETVHPFKPREVGGQEASDKARELLEGQNVIIHYDPDPKHGKWGKHGRLLAYLDLPDGRDFGLVMIQQGFARVYLKYPFSRQKRYLEAERIAPSEPCEPGN